MSFVVHKKVAGTMTGGEKASWAIQETITGFYTYTQMQHMHAYKALAGNKCFSERKRILTSLTVWRPGTDVAASTQLSPPLLQLQKHAHQQPFKSLLSGASASRHGQQPVSPPALVNRSVKSTGKLDNLSASQSDMAGSFFNKGIIASGLANTNVIIKIVLVI